MTNEVSFRPSEARLSFRPSEARLSFRPSEASGEIYINTKLIENMKVAVVGATGLVGTRMLEVLAERNFPVTELLPVASAKSVGRKITFQGKEWTVVSAEDAIAARPDLALFSAGGSTSAELAPKFAEVGTRVVDNSSQWRMDPTKKLVVPEINGDVLEETDYIIANPNCSTIQMLLPLWPLHKAYTIKRIVVSTYQSVTGTGYKAMDQMTTERAGGVWGEYDAVYPHPIDQNILPHIDSFLETGYTKEEMKMVHETHLHPYACLFREATQSRSTLSLKKNSHSRP